MRIVEYSAGYTADHWCERGHVAIVKDGDLTIEWRDGRPFDLKRGMGFQVQDGVDAHRAISRKGARIFIVD